MKGTDLLTVDQIKSYDPCSEGYKFFLTHFPDGGEYQAILDKCCEAGRSDWAEWLIRKVGPTEDVREYDEHVSSTELSIVFAGRVVFKLGAVVKRLIAGLGIEAGEGIEAGWGIEAGEGIKAGWGIKAGEGYGVFAGLRIRLSMWSRYAKVTAKSKPDNLISGEWEEMK
ncbi:hypothetical protein [Paenibacillus senegalensis]|uniref:hypothetical protein n=1 Tax=Paenibacillus senegalensis TaxID=1465766 RepID=UPI000289090D|nr:hypothetical protein [Paenibacillus senegalensis]